MSENSYKNYIKIKKGGIVGRGGGGGTQSGGTAKLKPPSSNTPTFQNVSFASVLDLVSEGPIYGPVNQDGTRAEAFEVASSVHYDETPIRAPKTRDYKRFDLKRNQITEMDTATVSKVNAALQKVIDDVSLTSNIINIGSDLAVNSISVTTATTSGQAKGYGHQSSPMSRGSSGPADGSHVFDTITDVIKITDATIRVVTSSNPSDNKLLSEISPSNTIGSGYLSPPVVTVNGQARTGMFTSLRLQVRPSKGLNDLFHFTTGQVEAQFQTEIDSQGRISKIDILDGGLYDSVSSIVIEPPNVVNNVQVDTAKATKEVNALKNRLSEFYTDSYLKNYAFARFNVSENFSGSGIPAVFEFTRNAEGAVETGFTKTNILTDILVDSNRFEREVQLTDTKDIQKAPNPAFFISPVVEHDKPFKTEQGLAAGFTHEIVRAIGGGLLFFYVGEEVTTGAGGGFDTGKFLISITGDDFQELNNYGQRKYDTIVFDRNHSLSFFPFYGQKNPNIRDLFARPMSLGFSTDVTDKYNYANSNIEYRLGDEYQSKLGNFSSGIKEYFVSKEILGPFRQSGDAQQGLGNNDVRSNADNANFATWQATLPVDSDEYPYTHIVHQKEVSKCLPTIQIDSLKDRISAGDNAGTDKAETLRIRVEHGFEGDDFPFGFQAGGNESRAAFTITGANDISVFRISPTGTHLHQIISGSGMVLRVTGTDTNGFKTGDIHLLGSPEAILKDDGTAYAGSPLTDMTQFGFNETHRGGLFYTINNYENAYTDNPLIAYAALKDRVVGSGYELPTLNFNFLGGTEVIEAELESGVSTGDINDFSNKIDLGGEYFYTVGIAKASETFHVFRTGYAVRANIDVGANNPADNFSYPRTPRHRLHNDHVMFSGVNLNPGGSGEHFTGRGLFPGGAFSGPVEIDGQFFNLNNQVLSVKPDLSIQDQVRISGNNESRVSGSLADGRSLKSIALAAFRQVRDFTFFGLITSPYVAELEIENLPNNKSLKGLKFSDISGFSDDLKTQFNIDDNAELFPGDSWKDVRRYVKMRKLDFETESILLERECRANSFIEFIKNDFTYPKSVLFGNTIDARQFAEIPKRSFDLRLKEVLIPANYNPLDTFGRDKRFIDNEETYGQKNVIQFNEEFGIEVPSQFDFGTRSNFEIEFKTVLQDTNQVAGGSGQFIFSTTKTGKVPFDGTYADPTDNMFCFVTGNTLYFSTGSGENTPAGIESVTGAGKPIVATSLGSLSANNQVIEGSVKVLGQRVELVANVTGARYREAGRMAKRPNFSLESGALIIGAYNSADGSTGHFKSGDLLGDFKVRKDGELVSELSVLSGSGIDFSENRFGVSYIDEIDPFGYYTPFFISTTGQIIRDASGIFEIQDVSPIKEVDSSGLFGKDLTKIYNGPWDGTLKTGWTDNPAWILYDMMTSPVYGMGGQLDDFKDIDIFKLYTLGRYCDGVDRDGGFSGVQDGRGGIEPRFSTNILIKDETNAFELIGTLASSFRAIPYWGGSSFDFTVDQPKPINALFNNQNVLDGQFNYSDSLKSARFSRVAISYLDKHDNFATKVVYAEDEDRIRKYGLVTHSAEGIGCTTEGQARRLANYILLSNLLETENVQFTAGQECLVLTPGDLIEIQDELKNFEISHGQIFDINTGSNPFVLVSSNIKTGLVDTEKGISMYSTPPQTDVNDLFDIAQFKHSGFVGSNNDYFSGNLALEVTEQLNRPQVTTFKITGFDRSGESLNKFLLNPNEFVFEEITGVKAGSTFNVSLTGRETHVYRVLSVSEKESNKFEVSALQFNTGKFASIEEANFREVEKPFNIGVPRIEYFVPTAPTSVQTGSVTNADGTFDITGVIVGAAGGTEDRYRAALTSPNGSYSTKEILKTSSIGGSSFDSSFRFFDLQTPGVYTLEVTSMRNPESTDMWRGKFTIPNTGES